MAKFKRTLVSDVNAVSDALTRNITENVVRNVLARLKDRCAHKNGDGDLCRISRAAHHCNSHDFTESTPSANGKV